MKRTNIDLNWEFMKGEPSNIPGMTRETKQVNLPHDFMIESDVTADSINGANTGFYNGDTATYTKYMDAPIEWAGKQIFVEFDGVYGSTKVILNGHVVGKHHYGYTPFCVDLTKYMKLGKKNRLAICVSNSAEQNSRWYSGAGIYRHVNLLTASKLHIANNGIFAYTSHIIGKDAYIIVETTVENNTDIDRDIWVDLKLHKLIDSGKREMKIDNLVAAKGMIKVHVPARNSAVARTQIMIEHALIWDIDNPNLYQIVADIVDENKEQIDSEKTNFGIRTISIDSKNGFVLNGRTLNLKGGCIHHDNGILGAASFRDSEYRKVQLHKENGYNALRFAHNPVSTDLLDACDRLGIVVLDEAFDTWNMSKNYHDFTQHFELEWKQELTSFIMRDRNHPSVIIWSIGNELPEQGGLSDGYQTSAMLSEYVRSIDSTRFVSGALCSFFNGLDDEDSEKFWGSLMSEAAKNGGALNNLDGEFGRGIWNDYTEAFVAPWDVVGYNYLSYHYEEAGVLFPNRVICCTESKPREMESYWADVEKYPYLIGDFEWTSHDYIGEAGIGKRFYVEQDEVAKASQLLHINGYPWRTAGAGEFDLCGFEKPQLAYRRIIWGSDETFIASHNPANYNKVEILDRYAWADCGNTWSWQAESGVPIKVEVYSAAEEVELLLNGSSIGRKPAGKNNHFIATFELNYVPGMLEAISYSGNQEISRDKVYTAKKATGLRIVPEKFSEERNTLIADGQSLFFARVEIVDDEENPVPYAETVVTAKVEGAGKLAALGSANPITEENYTIGKTSTYQGRVLAIIRASTEPGIVTLTIKSEEYGLAKLTVNVN